MKLAKFIDSSDSVRFGCVAENELIPLVASDAYPTLASILAASSPMEAVQSLATEAPITIDDSVRWLPPIDRQEVWAAGVTYKRSQTARMEESEAAASCYDRVYNADRPELFFKATPHRVAGNGQPLRIRADATWNVPEPEITLVLSPSMKIVGLTVGNDMSSRDIEGENPLYLPQAKCYDQCAGLGPWITLFDSLPAPSEITVDLKIERDGGIVFDQQTAGDQMARTFVDLVGWLSKDNSFPDGAFLMTGTGIVPTSDFTLLPGDLVHITIAGVGTLTNPIVQG
ncbi:fumarylacetoacetate hydrolase family protein [Rhodopirellula sp. MGV]|uniref:fumarylacetoacetate hydrolase family protein n=1 Tax=Rhodopirellula sp. MGV TaxID=2023130 RepID=UPI000B96B668|nr:fumarylacetoacetate hydrolase family protein [Rhodopirellula sp. MGV]OYP35509.1 2-hydroxyhepta-2,4-diene-1,7-dioate isomerase [Rhodopirellula sp. MGV]PNY34472.1 2-hydroxyhepta-2,4-diene-1,7-dioate isomerase [Rhodopirellula baltica]